MKPPYFRRNRVDLYRMKQTALLGPRKSRQTTTHFISSCSSSWGQCSDPQAGTSSWHTNPTGGRITKTQNGWHWKGPLDVTSLNLPGQAGPPRATCSGPCPDSSCVSTRRESSPPPWAAWGSAWSPSQSKDLSDA